MRLNLSDTTVEYEDVSLDETNSKIYEFALREACTGYCYDNNIFSLFFTRNRLLKIWNLYPDFRSAILQNVIMRPFSWKNSLSKEESDLLAANCKTICKKIEEDMEGDLSPEWAMTQDRLEDLGYISVERDFTGNLEKLSDNQTGDAYRYWLDRYLTTLDSSNEQEFERLYLSIKRAKGATEIRRDILNAALRNEALSEKILKKIIKSSPITLRRSIVRSLADEKRSCQNILYYQDESRRNWVGYSDEDFKAAKEKAAKVESKLILFAPVQDSRIQGYLIDVLDKENLVWIVPAVSSIGRSYLSNNLQRRMTE